MKLYKVIQTGSEGNAVIYFDNILVDCGIPFSVINSYIGEIKLILLSHSHKDHINLSTLKSIQFINPLIRVGCCEWMVEHLKSIRNIDVYKLNEIYDYVKFQISPFKLYHDVPNCGYRIIKEDKKVFHATDTAHLNGITAKHYDLYAIEHNYDEEILQENIMKKAESFEYSYEIASRKRHLSDQQAREFIFNNRKPESEILRLHESKNN